MRQKKRCQGGTEKDGRERRGKKGVRGRTEEGRKEQIKETEHRKDDVRGGTEKKSLKGERQRKRWECRKDYDAIQLDNWLEAARRS